MAIAFMDYMIALRASGLPGPTRSVALWVATRCANGWPVTIETIAMDSGFSAATVKRHLVILETSGWLSRQTDRNKGNRYELQIPTSSLAQSEPTDGSERANGMAQSEPADGSERANRMAQSEPTYIRTIQEHKNNKNLTCARTPAREGDAATIKHSNLNEGLLARWVRELVKVPEAKEEILRLKFRKAPGEVYQTMFVTSLYTSEALFERFRPWFVRLQSEGRL